MPNSEDSFDIATSLSSVLVDEGCEVRLTYLALTIGLVRIPGLSLRTGSHGFISREMRFYRDKDWCVSLVPNKRWVRLYIRRPELGRGRFDIQAFRMRFQTAELTALEEIALNISGEEVAREVLLWLETHL